LPIKKKICYKLKSKEVNFYKVIESPEGGDGVKFRSKPDINAINAEYYYPKNGDFVDGYEFEGIENWIRVKDKFRHYWLPTILNDKIVVQKLTITKYRRYKVDCTGFGTQGLSFRTKPDNDFKKDASDYPRSGSIIEGYEISEFKDWIRMKYPDKIYFLPIVVNGIQAIFNLDSTLGFGLETKNIEILDSFKAGVCNEFFNSMNEIQTALNFKLIKSALEVDANSFLEDSEPGKCWSFFNSQNIPKIISDALLELSLKYLKEINEKIQKIIIFIHVKDMEPTLMDFELIDHSLHIKYFAKYHYQRTFSYFLFRILKLIVDEGTFNKYVKEKEELQSYYDQQSNKPSSSTTTTSTTTTTEIKPEIRYYVACSCGYVTNVQSGMKSIKDAESKVKGKKTVQINVIIVIFKKKTLNLKFLKKILMIKKLYGLQLQIVVIILILVILVIKIF